MPKGPRLLMELKERSKIVPGTERRTLTGAQAAFVGYYCGRAAFNQVEACRLMGHREQATAERVSKSMMGSPCVLRAIKERIESIYADGQITGERVIQRLRAIAEADFWDFHDVEVRTVWVKRRGPDGADVMVESEEQVAVPNLQKAMALGVMAAVKGVDYGPTGAVSKIHLHSKMEALTLLARHFGLLQDRVEITHKSDEEELRRRILEKLDKAAQCSAN